MTEENETRGLRFNDGKIRYDLIPPLAHRECAKVWTKGLDKYPENNWEKGMPWSEVIASALRHLEAIRLGEDIDPIIMKNYKGLSVDEIKVEITKQAEEYYNETFKNETK